MNCLKRALVILFAVLTVVTLNAKEREPKTILVVSGWQDVNIGDIAHTPGLLHILQTYLPDANIIVWEKNVGKEVEEFLYKNFPKIKIVHGAMDKNAQVDSEEVLKAFREADLMIHGSGPYIVGQYHLEAWVKYTHGKPFGIFGTTIPKVDQRLKNLLKQADFIYTRETASIDVLKQAGITGSHIRFVPDATFFFNLRDKKKGNDFLKANDLEKGKFICAVPRLRRTPYYLIKNRHLWSEAKIREVESYNNRYKEEDHSKLREAIVSWVRRTGNKVLVCPEMTYQVDFMDELLIDSLPVDVKPYVVKRGYWLPDEAASVYAASFAVLSFECHSPIIAAANGTPFFYLRQPDDTIKGQMYYDLGCSDWTFEIEETTGTRIADRLAEIETHYPKAKRKVKGMQKKIADLYKDACKPIKRTLYQ